MADIFTDEQLILTPQRLWAEGYTFPEKPLNEVQADERPLGDRHFVREVHIDGRVLDEQSVRVLLRVVSSDTRDIRPVMIFLPDVGCDVDEKKLATWADAGYTAVGVDYCCAAGERATVYPQSLEYCAYGKFDRHYGFVDTTAEETVWFNWAYSVRRAIHYAETIAPGAEICLISEGEASKIAMMVLGTDKRIKSAAILFGSIWEEYKNQPVNYDEIPEEDIEAHLNEEFAREQEITRRITAVSPQAYAPFINVPLLVVQGTNSSKTDPFAVYETVKRVNARVSADDVNKKFSPDEQYSHEPQMQLCQLYFIPRMMEAHDERQMEYIKKWFKKAEPVQEIMLSAQVREGELILKASLENLGSVSDVRIYYSRGDSPAPVRNWVVARDGVHLFSSFEAVCDVVDPSQPIWFFCNAVHMGSPLSSAMCEIIPAELEGEITCIEKTRLMYNGRQGAAEFVPLNPTLAQDIDFVTPSLHHATGPYEVSGICGRNIATYCLNDPLYVFDDTVTLTFDVFVPSECDLDVFLALKWHTDEQVILKSVQKLVGGDLWQKISIPLSEFKAVGTRQTDTEFSQMVLAVCAEEEIIINNLLVI